MKFEFIAMETAIADGFRNGALDANGQKPERIISDGDGNPCRHCQKDIAAGKPMLVLSYRPFSNIQPYAESGPIFLCAEPCEHFETLNQLPDTVIERPEFLVRGYDADQRIVGGTGKVMPTGAIESYVSKLMEDSKVASVHIRSASNNCYFGAIKRAE